jgi:hypothetical protein
MAEPQTREGLHVDLSLWPLALVEMGGVMREEDGTRMLEAYEQFYARRERFQVLTDNTELRSFPGAAFRKKLADASKLQDEQAKRWLIGSAVVMPNPIVRGALTAFHWIAPPVYKITVHKTRLEGLDEVIRTFEAHKIPVTAAIRSYRHDLIEGLTQAG